MCNTSKTKYERTKCYPAVFKTAYSEQQIKKKNLCSELISYQKDDEEETNTFIPNFVLIPLI